MKISFALGMLLVLVTSVASAQDVRPDPTQNPEAQFRLFATRNIYTFLKIDTRDGRIWQVQWGARDYRFTETLNPNPLVTPGKPGRFTLYPTSNIYTFLLLDQESGNTWHVQWGKPDERFTQPIRDASKE